MKIIHTARQMWKTTTLVRLSAQTGKYILCLDEQRCRNIVEIAKKEKLNIPYPITLREIQSNNMRWTSADRDWIYIDDAWDILQRLIPIPIDTITLT
jgi:hypothetical protein